MFEWLLVARGEIPKWESKWCPQIDTLEIKIFVLQHLSSKLDCWQDHRKCFSEIFQHPTNHFIRIITQKSISKLRICLSCELKPASFADKIFTCGHVCNSVKFQNKNLNDNPMSVLLESLIMPCAHIQEYVLIGKYAHYAITYVYVHLKYWMGRAYSSDTALIVIAFRS